MDTLRLTLIFLLLSLSVGEHACVCSLDYADSILNKPTGSANSKANE